MKKWLSLLVMTCIVLGAAYFAVATESGSKVQTRSATTLSSLDEIDALLANDPGNQEFLDKRAQIVAELASQGIEAPAALPTNEIDESKARALAEDRARQEASGEYYGMLLDRLNNGSVLTPVEKVELLESGMLKGEEDPAYQAIVSDIEISNDSYYRSLVSRMEAGQQLSAKEKEDLDASGLLYSEVGSREGRDNLDDIGGPSLTAYRWIDNQNGDTATYAWEELDTTAGATSITTLATSDDGNAAISWGWNFPFFGTNYTSGWVTVNGYLALNAASGDFSNDCRRSTGTPTGPTIMPFWDDLHTGTGGPGVPDEGRLVWQNFTDHMTITWDSVGICCTDATDLVDLQCQIWDSGKIKFQYRYLRKNSGTDIDGTSPTIGIQQSNNAGGLDSLIYYCNSTIMDSAYTNHLGGRAIWFYPSTLDADDYTTTAILQPTVTRVVAGSSFNVVGRFRNAGTVAQSSPVGYIFNNGTPVTDVTDVLASNGIDTVDFAGTETAPLTAGNYELKVFTGLSTDQNLENDTVRVTIQVFNCYDEQKTNAFADTFTTCGAVNDWSATCLGTADASEDYIFEWTITEPGAYNILAIGTTTTTRGLLVSSACPPDSFNCLASLNQSQDTLLINCLALDAGTYYIMVDRSTGCDQVRLYTAPCLDHDFAIESVLQPTPLRVSPSASFNVVGRFRNIGTSTEAADVAYSFNGGGVVTGVTASVAPGAPSDVDFTGTETAPAVVGDYELLMYSNLSNDENRTNDTLRVTVLVRECSDEDQTDAFVDAGTTCGAGNEWFNTCVGSADASEDYIYRWTTTTNGAWNLLLTATTSATRGLVISTACPPDSFNCVAFVNTTNDSAALNCVPLAAGTYYIMVDRSTGCDAYNLAVSACTDLGRCCYNGGVDCETNGAYDCQQLTGSWTRGITCESAPCPIDLNGGETCAEAVAISVPSTVRGVTTGGVDDDPTFTCESNFNGDDYFGSNTAPDKWYTIVGTGDIIKLSLCNTYTNFDTQILVTCSDDCANFTCVGGNDDAFTAGCAAGSARSIETFCSELGRTYYVVVDGWSAGAGLFELAITDSVPCAVFVDCAPEGRCCYLDNGAAACVDNLAAECTILNGQWLGTTTCAVTPCPVARCCYLDNGAAACADLTDLECQSLNGVWTSATTCAATPCAVGRCCYLDGGLAACQDLTELECDALVGQWDDALSCATDPCPVGRCCYVDGENQLCADNTELECTALNGVWNDALDCTTPCPTILQGADNCIDAVEIPTFGQQYLGTNVGFTGETALPACVTWYGIPPATPPAVWYKIMGTGNSITVTLCDLLTDYDTEIGIFCGETCETLICVTSDDDACTTPSLASTLTFCSVLGAEYKLLVTAFNTGLGNFAMTVTDDATPCVPVVACPVTVVPCDPITNLAASLVSVAQQAEHLQLHFVAPQDADYKVWYSTIPNNDGNPDDGADVNFVLESTILGVTAAQVVVYDAPTGFTPYRYYVVTANCGN